MWEIERVKWDTKVKKKMAHDLVKEYCTTPMVFAMKDSSRITSDMVWECCVSIKFRSIEVCGLQISFQAKEKSEISQSSTKEKHKTTLFSVNGWAIVDPSKETVSKEKVHSTCKEARNFSANSSVEVLAAKAAFLSTLFYI